MKVRFVLVVLLVLLAALPTPASAKIDVHEKSAVVFELDYKTQKLAVKDVLEGKDCPDAKNGSVFEVQARKGVKLYFRVTGVNPRKYDLKVNSEEVKPEQVSMPAGEVKLSDLDTLIKKSLPAPFLAALPKTEDSLPDMVGGVHRTLASTGAKGPVGRVEGGASSDVWPSALRSMKDAIDQRDALLKQIDIFNAKIKEFDDAAKALSLLTQKMKSIEECIQTADCYDDLRESIVKLGDMEPVFGNAEESVPKMRDALKELELLKDENDVGQDYAVKYAEEVYEKVSKMEADIPKMQARLLECTSPKEGEALFVMPNADPVEYKGGKLLVTVALHEKGKDKPKYNLDFDVRSEDRNFFDASEGFLVSQGVDQPYALETVVENQVSRTVIAQKGGKEGWRMDPGVLLTYGWDFGKVDAGFSAGFTQSESKIRVYFGPTFIFGSERQFRITPWGKVLVPANRLKGYSIGDTFTGVAADIPQQSVSRWTDFFAVTYKF